MKHILSISILIFITFQCFCLVCLSTNLDDLFRASQKKVSFFYFSQMWPGSYCTTIRCHNETIEKLAEDFIIDGLHPAQRNGKILTYCDNGFFELDEISDLIGAMKQNWPILHSYLDINRNYRHWSYQWSTYGTCSDFEQRKYFKMALELKNKTKLIEILKDRGIEPNGGTYRIGYIQTVIKSALGFTPQVRTYKDPNGHAQLLKIISCVQISGDLISCPKHELKTSDAQVKFPVF